MLAFLLTQISHRADFPIWVTRRVYSSSVPLEFEFQFRHSTQTLIYSSVQKGILTLALARIKLNILIAGQSSDLSLKWRPRGRSVIISQGISGMRMLAYICIILASETDVIQLTSKGKQRHVLCVPRSCKQGVAISDRVKSILNAKSETQMDSRV